MCFIETDIKSQSQVDDDKCFIDSACDIYSIRVANLS